MIKCYADGFGGAHVVDTDGREYSATREDMDRMADDVNCGATVQDTLRSFVYRKTYWEEEDTE